MKFKKPIEVQAGISDGDPTNPLGLSGYLLSSDGSNVNWIDQGDVVAAGATRVLIACKNTSGGTITKGTPVYQTGNVGATDVIEIAAADALISTGYLPAIGLLETDLTNNAFGNVVITGELLNITTNPIDGSVPVTGDTVYLKSGGGLTLTKPTGEGNAIQNLGLVGKVSGGNAGSLTVASIMRQNDVPNLPEGRIWIGDGNTIVSDTVYVDEPNNRVGIGTTTPSTDLEVSSTGVNGVDISQSASNASQSGRLFFTTNTASEGFALFNSNGTFQVNSGGIPNNTSGTNRISIIGSSGNVGIGTTSPNHELVVEGDTSSPNIELKNTSYSNGGFVLNRANYTQQWKWWAESSIMYFGFSTDESTYSNKLVIKSDGNVGIGATSPDSKLEVASTDSNTFVHIRNDSTGSTRLKLSNSSDTNSNGFQIINNSSDGQVNLLNYKNTDLGLWTNSQLRVLVDNGGNVGIGTTSPDTKLEVSSLSGGVLRLTSTDTSVATGESIGRVEFKSNDASTGGNNVMGFVDCLATNAGSTYALTFGTGSAAAATEKMRINQSGNVGIGTTSPSELLHLSSTGPARLLIEADTDNITETDNAQIILKQDGGAVVGNLGYKTNTNSLEITNNYAAADGILTLGTSGIERMRIDYLGNVGIGTTSPKAKLHVVSGTSGATWTATAGTTGVFESSTGDRSFVTITGEDEAELWFGDFTTQAKGRVRYQTDTNVMSFWTNGTQKMTIDASGNVGNISNVGIGTTSLTTISSAVATLSLGSTSASTSGGIAFQANGVVKAYNYVASNYLYSQTVGGIGQIFYIAGSERMRIHNTTGNVGIGTTSPNSKLHVAGTVSLSTPLANFNGSVGSGTYGAVSVRVDNINYGTAMKFYRSLTADNNAIGFQNGASTVGSISIGTSSTSYNTTSDYRLKENLTAITDGIYRLKQLKPRRFNFIGNADVVDGFIAHEAKEVIPESVTGKKDEVLPNGDPVYQGIDQAKIVPLLTAALQEAISKIEQLETRIQTLENK